MRLKRLEIQGFKSFADRTVIEFGRGLTAVVGPNGSGKSNLVDAIRWVLGEQNPRMLRAQRMDELIFSGTNNRRRISICEVTLVLDNSDGGLAVDFDEVAITRRMARDGVSEYYINRVACRLKDINDLFFDTGIGKEAYSVVGQGKIDEILLAKPDDRRGLFEEASGIARYRNRKREAMRKMDDTDEGRLRLADLIHEIESQIEPLTAESLKAQEALTLTEQLRVMEIGRIIYRARDIDKSLLQKQQRMRTLAENASKDRERLTVAEKELLETNEALSRLHADIARYRAESENAQTRLGRCATDRIQTQERQNALSQSIERAKQNAMAVEARLNEASKRLELEQAMVLETEDKARDAQKGVELAQTELQAHDKQYLKTHSALEESRKEYDSLKAEHSESLSKARVCETLLATSEAEIKRLEDDIMRRQASVCGIDEKLAEQHRGLAELETLMGEFWRELSALDKEIESHEGLIAKQRRDVQERERSLSDVVGRKAALEGMRERLVGYSEGPRKVLTLGRDGRLDGILGAVAQVLTVEEGYERAIEAALGASAQYVVVETAQSAQKAIEELKRTKSGRATFLPLDTIHRYSLNDLQRRAIAEIDGARPATEVIKCDQTFERLVQNLLGRCAVVPDVGAAVRLGRSTSFGLRIATLDGDLVNPGGSMSGGSRANTRAGLFSQSAELRRLRKDEQNHRNTLREMRTVLSTTSSAFEELTGRRASVRTKAVETEFETKTVLLGLENLRSERVSAQKSLAALQCGLATAGDAKQTHQKNILRYTEHALNLQRKLEELSEQHTALQSEGSDSGREREAAQARLADASQRLARLEEASIASKRLLESLRGHTEELKEQFEHDLSEVESLSASLSQADALFAELQERELVAQQALVNARAKEHELTETQEACRQNTVALERMVRQLSRSLDSINVALINVTAEETGLATSLRALEENLNERYSVALGQAENEFDALDESADARISGLRTALENLGQINPNAPQQLERAKERLAFVRSQDEDLSKARASLTELITEIDDKMARLFVEAFEQIKAGFKEIFGELFSGGEADLLLTDPSNALESGIEIVARPSGRSAQPLTLLSGGEKSLSAIALLFAMQKLRPSPFCVLDEIEASLDEANIERFCAFLNRQSEHNQYILITHQKRTMEISDVLYGLTSEQAGVSRTISYKLVKSRMLV